MVLCRGRFARKRRNTLAPRVHQSHRNVVTLSGHYSRTGQTLTTGQLIEKLLDEADKTRWWLQKHNHWLGSDVAEKVQVFIDNTDATKQMYIYPVFDDPNLPEPERIASYYLGFDAKIYIQTEDGYEPFLAEEHSMQPEVAYLVKQLRRLRRR